MTLDDRAGDAARALHDDVVATVDTEGALVQVLAARGANRRRRLPAVAAAVAVLALVAGAVAVVATGDDESGDSVAVDMDPDAVEGTPLQLLGPRDGMQSIRLPVTVEPSVDLVDGHTVHVTATGFEPGESVGIVQCTSDSGPPTLAGVDACMISPFTQATADAGGAIAGDYAVRRLLTVPYSGTVDCATAPDRCMIAVGAIANYDRSGVVRISFVPTDEPYAVPTVEVTPTTGLADRQMVHVSGSGYTGSSIGLRVCSASPAVCWQTGDPDLDPPEVSESGEYEYNFGYSLMVSSDGTIDGDVPVWRFLPGPEPGSYVDCAVSACTLRIDAERAPAPVPLAFSGIEAAPTAPIVRVTPDANVRSGDVVVVEGTGIQGERVYLSLCAYEPAEVASPEPGVGGFSSQYCTSIGDTSGAEVTDGAFVYSGALGSFDESQCGSDPQCVQITPDPTWNYAIEVYVERGEGADASWWYAPPTFEPMPVPIGFVAQ